MKKTAITIIMALCLGFYAQAQVNAHALGLRLGGNGDVNGAEISYQHGLGDKHRLEFDLGWGGNDHHNRMFVAGIYHWDWNLKGGLNWYIGPGASVGFYNYDNSIYYINVAVGGQVGLEYDFSTMDVPILLSLDTRPMWDFLGDNAGLGWGVALGVRYIW